MQKIILMNAKSVDGKDLLYFFTSEEKAVEYAIEMQFIAEYTLLTYYITA